MVKVVYRGIIKTALGTREEQVDLPDGATVRMLLKHLKERHGSKFEEHILDATETGLIRKEAIILVDGMNIESLQGIETPLSESSETLVVMLAPVSAGG